VKTADPRSLGFRDDWDVPEFSFIPIASRRHKTALVIPVINEGQRLQKQLRQIQSLRAEVDVIIADGGSTDDSVSIDLLKNVGVTALLVKIGPGKLSAQLRMAYAWVLAAGYVGVVTVDGNGKDGVEAIPRFLVALDAGFDYVQGSRHIAGGQATNTPLDRYIANRFVHAPLVSLGARKWLTDTANGFRAYSARALLDPRVAPFRHVFCNYSLLFYLSMRISRLGYKVCEIPVSRCYPPAGKTPTKIAGFFGRLSLLRELLLAVSGGYNPGKT